MILTLFSNFRPTKAIRTRLVVRTGRSRGLQSAAAAANVIAGSVFAINREKELY